MGSLSGGYGESVWRILGGCLDDVGRLSVGMLSGGCGCVEGVARLFGRCGEAVWREWGGCLDDVGRLSGGCGEAVWRVWGGCLDDVGRLSGECGEAVWMMWGGCLESVGRLSGGMRLGSQRGVCPHVPVNHMVFFLCHGFIKFMYINEILMKTSL